MTLMRPLILSATLFFFSFSLFIGIDRFTRRKKHHFSLSSIAAAPEMPPPSLRAKQEKKIEALFNQPFFFFGKSHHAYLFLSEDHKYILKFLKSHALAPKSALAYLPLSFNPHYRDYKHKKEEQARLFTGYQTAFDELKDETGLVYMHLYITHRLNRKITLYEKNSKPLIIDLDKTCFYLQKRAQLIYPRISELMRNGDFETAQTIISSVFTLIEDLRKKGVIDQDLTLYKNFGIIDDKAVQLAIGKLHIDRSRSVCSKEEIVHIMDPFRRWIQKNYPQLLAHFDSELANI
jgi:hypothetical protein